jgi:hypothetical protein
MRSRCSKRAGTTIYRYRRPLSSLDWIFFGFWTAAATIEVYSRSKLTWWHPLIVVLVLLAFILSRRIGRLEIGPDRFSCEVLPGKKASILFGSLLAVREGPGHLCVVHHFRSTPVCTYLSKQAFTSEHWRQIIDAITQQSRAHAPAAEIELAS